MIGEQHLDDWGRFYRLLRSDRRRRSKELMDLVGLHEERAKKAKAYRQGRVLSPRLIGTFGATLSGLPPWSGPVAFVIWIASLLVISVYTFHTRIV